MKFRAIAKKHKRCEYQTREEIAALDERDYIILGREYDINNILEDIHMFDQTQYFDDYFHRSKLNLTYSEIIILYISTTYIT